MPSHRSEGDNATHVGKVNGDFASQQVTMHVTQNFYPPQTEAPETNLSGTGGIPVPQPRSRQPTPAEQSAVLRRLDQLINRVPILEFMERDFQTRMVIDLEVAELKRVHLYLDAVMSDPMKLKPEFRRKKRDSGGRR